MSDFLLDNYKYHLAGGLTVAACLLVKVLRGYFGGGVCKSKARLDGKTVIITGSNTGIGKETALDLAKRGARVIIACRDVRKGEEAAEEIRKLSGNGNVLVEYLDLSSLQSVRDFALKMNRQEEKVNVLVNNAALHCGKAITKDGFDMVFGVNHLGHFLLTNLLLDKLKASAPSRIVNVSSRAHEKIRMNWDDIMYTKNYNFFTSYQQSKLVMVLFTRQLAKQLSGTGVTTYALHPGLSLTGMLRYQYEDYPFLKIVKFLLTPITWLILKNAKEAAQTSIYCAVDEELASQNGLYYSDCKVKELLPHAKNDEDAARLWKLSEELTKKFL